MNAEQPKVSFTVVKLTTRRDTKGKCPVERLVLRKMSLGGLSAGH